MPEEAEGLVLDAEQQLGRDAGNEIADIILVGAARKVEHMEMAGYETARAIAEALEMDEAAKLLGETLREEQQTDKRLEQIAKPLLKAAAEAEEDLEAEDADEV